MLILPGHPLFDVTLATPPPGWREVAEKHNTWAWVAGTDGILRVATPDELEDYLWGGEYEEAKDGWEDFEDYGEDGEFDE